MVNRNIVTIYEIYAAETPHKVCYAPYYPLYMATLTTCFNNFAPSILRLICILPFNLIEASSIVISTPPASPSSTPANPQPQPSPTSSQKSKDKDGSHFQKSAKRARIDCPEETNSNVAPQPTTFLDQGVVENAEIDLDYMSSQYEFNGVNLAYNLTHVPPSFISLYEAQEGHNPTVLEMMKNLHEANKAQPKDSVPPMKYILALLPSIRDPSTASSPSPKPKGPTLTGDVFEDMYVPPSPFLLHERYDAARAVYAAHGYHIVSSYPNIEFFTKQPIRIFQATVSPHLVISIVKSTVSYARRCRNTSFTFSITDFFLYICAIVDTLLISLYPGEHYFSQLQTAPALKQNHFNDIKRYIQFTPSFIRGVGREANKQVKLRFKKNFLRSTLEFSKMYSEWIMQVVKNPSCVVLDEIRIGFKQNEPRTGNSNPHPNVQVRKPQRYGFQFYSLHLADVNILLNLSPTIRNYNKEVGCGPNLPETCNTSTSVVNNLLTAIGPATSTYKATVIADGWFGSLESAILIHELGHDYTMRINRNSKGLNPVLLHRVQTTHNEYVHFTLNILKNNHRYTSNILRSGYGKSNLTISSRPPNHKLVCFPVRRTKDGVIIPVELPSPLALYKLYANACDIANSYVSHMKAHSLISTRIFSIRFYHYFLTLFISQTRLFYNAIFPPESRTHNFPKQEGSLKSFLRLFSFSIRYMTLIEHHCAVPIGIMPDQRELKNIARTHDLRSIQIHVKGNVVHNGSEQCLSTKKGMTHSQASVVCVGCLFQKPIDIIPYACTPCAENKHNPNHLVG